jgi:hypothetical protein
MERKAGHAEKGDGDAIHSFKWGWITSDDEQEVSISVCPARSEEYAGWRKESRSVASKGGGRAES